MVTSSLGPPRAGGHATLYDAVGGMAFFERLVREFYDRVAADDVLVGLYPEPDDLEPARQRLWLFLGQYFGGPTTYSDERGHPRLRMRHHPFVIDPDARDRWLAAMRGALDAVAASEALDAEMWTYFTMAAEAMRNAE